jgi:hypothetical protein
MVQGGESKARVVKVITKQVPGDVIAQIFWLKNRMRERWRDVRAIDAKVQPGRPAAPRRHERRGLRVDS